MFNSIQKENYLDYSDEFIHTRHDVLLSCNYTEGFTKYIIIIFFLIVNLFLNLN